MHLPEDAMNDLNEKKLVSTYWDGYEMGYEDKMVNRFVC
jgi:hypothetical protein